MTPNEVYDDSQIQTDGGLQTGSTHTSDLRQDKNEIPTTAISMFSWLNYSTEMMKLSYDLTVRRKTT